MAAPNSSAANGQVRGGLTSDDIRSGEKLIWTQTDGARVFVIVTRLTPRVAYLRCHYGDRAWTRRHELPLFPSMRRGHWTTADVQEESSRER